MPRAKRSDADTQEMRRQTVAAARALIAEQGVHGVSARALAERVDCAVGTLYTLFPTLGEVTLHANAAELIELKAVFDATLADASERPAIDQLLALAEAYLRFTSGRARNWAAVFEREAEGDPPDWYRAHQLRLFAVVEGAVAPLTATDLEARQATRALWAAVQGLSQLSVAGHLRRVSDDSVQELAAYLVATFVAGLQARRGAPQP